MNDVKAARLVSGEMIIGEVEFIDQDKGKSGFKNLLQIIIIPIRENEKSIRFSFAPLHPFYDINEILEIKENHIVMWIKVLPQSIIDAYKKAISPSSIATPQKNIILPK